MQEKVQHLIKEIGLEVKEAEIYLAILQLSKASITDIAKKSKIKRTTIYEYIDNLSQKNLIYKTVEGKRIFYIAENPEKLLKIVENKKRKILEILPSLQNIYNTSFHRPQIKFYEGIDGLRAIYKEMSSSYQTIYGAFSADKYFSVLSSKDNDEFFKNIREHGGQIKDLIEDTPLGRKHARSKFYKGIGSPKIFPKDFSLGVDLMIAGDKVAMMSLVNLVGVIIENPEIAELQRNFIKFIRRSIK